MEEMMYKVKATGFGRPFQKGAILIRGRKSILKGNGGEAGYMYTLWGGGDELLLYDNEVEPYNFKDYINAL